MARLQWVAIAVGSAAALLAAGAIGARLFTVKAPAGQPAVVEIDASTFDTLKDRFNAASEKPRLLALLSPT